MNEIPGNMEIIRNTDIGYAGNLVATIGMFDGVHLGHQALLQELRETARLRGLKSAVITFGKHPQQVLRPETRLCMILTLENRLKYLDEMGIDIVIVMDFNRELAKLDSKAFMQLLQNKYGVKTLVMGFNHHFGCNRGEFFEDYVAHGEDIGMEVLRASEYRGECSPVSSSLIRKMIEEGRVDLAECYLGRSFELSGVVVHGFKNGRKLGYPTANIDIDSDLIMPHRGVYAVNVILENGKIYGGMANIGVRPTVVKGGERTFEVNIFDFDGDLYDRILKVRFVKFMRSEMKMSSLDELKERLAMDKLACMDVLAGRR